MSETTLQIRQREIERMLDNTKTIKRTFAELQVGDKVQIGGGEFVEVLELDKFQSTTIVSYRCTMNPQRVRVYEFSDLVTCLKEESMKA